MLSALDTVNKEQIIEFIYAQQIVPKEGDPEEMAACYGFRPGPGLSSTVGYTEDSNAWKYDHAHVTMTYTAICTLLTLGDDLSRVNKQAIVSSLRHLQQPSGAFVANMGGNECDMRFLYCAVCICWLLNDWSGIDKEAAVRYVQACHAWDGGLALSPGLESHGGSTFTGLASLIMMDKLSSMPEGFVDSVTQWCIMRQVNGYQGRINKDPDSCYCFWVGASLHLLGYFDLTDFPSTAKFVLTDCQKCKIGGFSKVPGAPPDLLHSFFSLTWLSMAGKAGLRSLDPRVVFCQDRLPAHCRS